VRRVKHSVHSLFAYREFPSGTLVTFCNLHFPSSSGRQYKSLHIVFQFATVPHFLCGAYLTSRFKRGNRSSRIDLTLPSRILRFPLTRAARAPYFCDHARDAAFLSAPSIRTATPGPLPASRIRYVGSSPNFLRTGRVRAMRFTFVTPPLSVCVTTPIFVSARLFTLSCEG
jgi:hypothetical protein